LLVIDLVAVDPRDVLRLALATKLSACDAAYLQVALQLDCQVITFDKKLAAAARVMRV
jgi:predicted nucleic acid-binding protein